MRPSDLAKLAVDLASGAITEDWITERYGDGVLTTVLGFGLGVGVGSVIGSVMDKSGISDVIDDLFGGIL